MLMTEPIWQFRLLAQGGDGEGWMNILFIVVVAAFWAIGAIVKAAGTGRRDRQQREGRSSEQNPPPRETLLQKLAKKAEEFQRAVELQGKEAIERPRQPERQGQKPRPARAPQAAPGRVNIRTGRGGQPVLVYERQTSSPEVSRETQGPPRTSTAPTRRQKDLKAKPESAPAASLMSQQAVPAWESSLLLDYSNIDALKRAVLHCEILGKPLAIRDPLEQGRLF